MKKVLVLLALSAVATTAFSSGKNTTDEFITNPFGDRMKNPHYVAPAKGAKAKAPAKAAPTPKAAVAKNTTDTHITNVFGDKMINPHYVAPAKGAPKKGGAPAPKPESVSEESVSAPAPKSESVSEESASAPAKSVSADVSSPAELGEDVNPLFGMSNAVIKAHLDTLDGEGLEELAEEITDAIQADPVNGPAFQARVVPLLQARMAELAEDEASS